MEEKKSFMDSGVSTSKTKRAQMEKPEEVSAMQETYPSLLSSFLQTCMNLLRDNKVIEGLQELIDNCVGKGKPLPKQHAMHKVDKGKKRTGREMRLIT